MANQKIPQNTDRKGLQRREFLLALPATTFLPLPSGETPDPEGRLSPSEKKQFDALLVLREKLDRIIKSGDEDAILTVEVIFNLVLRRIKESRDPETNIQSRATDPKERIQEFHQAEEKGGAA